MPSKSYNATQGGPQSQRQLRVGEMIRHALSDMLIRGDIHDDVIASHVITVSEVRMSPDLKVAKVFIMPLGGQDVDAVVTALNNNKRFIRGEIAHKVHLKYAPEIRFLTDESFEEANRIDEILESPKVRRDLDES